MNFMRLVSKTYEGIIEILDLNFAGYSTDA